MQSKSKRRFRVAFSLAGEKREFVAEVADILAKQFGESAILYYKYHEAEFARRDLGVYLPELYHKESDLIVVVICPEYDEKEWTGLEWTAIHDLLKKRRDEEVMLFRFERAEVSGLYSSAGFVDLDDKSPEQAAKLILERLALNEGFPKNHYIGPLSTTQPPTTSIPNNLPRLQSFFGRNEELEKIAEALDPASRTWGALIDGPGGMGKTSLAVRAAYDCSPDQFDRIIFLSVKDRELDDDGERQLGSFILPGFLEMLNELARQLGQPDIMKAAETERVRLILEALTPTKTLIILDNLESLTKSDRDQLFTFVKRLPQRCKAILTSRRRIGSSADVVILSNLDETAALEILDDLAKHNPLLAKSSDAERRSLYAETGGNPLLLRWTAGQLGRGSCRTLEDALEFLRSCPPGNDPLEFVFGDLANEFTFEETRVLVALTYFTLGPKVKHIAAVADLTEEITESTLGGLANRSLVVPDQEEKAFTLVPMVADFLRRKRPEVVTDTGNRLEQRAYALILENGYEKHSRFSVLDSEWPTIAPALPLFISGPNEPLQTVCDALRIFLEFTLRWDESFSLLQQAETRAEVGGDYVSAGWRATDSGWIHYLRRQPDEVLASANRAEAHWNHAETDWLRQGVLCRLQALAYRYKGDYAAAKTAITQAIDLFRKSNARYDLARALNSLANIDEASGDLISAEAHYAEALENARSVEDAEVVAVSTSNLGRLMAQKQQWVEAERFASEALSLSEKLGRFEAIPFNHFYLARSLSQQGRKSEAVPHAQSALLFFEELGIESNIEAARTLLAECAAEDDLKAASE